MTAQPWFRHPAVLTSADDGVRTRLGMAPNHVSFRAGVLRTHLVTALLAHSAARALDTSPEVFARWDDTNRRRAGATAVDGLLREITDTAQIPLSPLPDGVSATADQRVLRQSERADRYATAVRTLHSLGVATRREGAWWLDLAAVDRLMYAAGADPVTVVGDAVVNVRGVPTEHATGTTALTRADGSHLWHLVTVVDDLDLKVTLVVRASDKVNAVAVQERLRWLLSGGAQRVVYVFLPRLLEDDTQLSRTAHLLASGIRPSALRWFLSEPYLVDGGRPAYTFDDLVARVRPTLPAPVDGLFDTRRLASFDRKIAASLPVRLAEAELADAVRNGQGDGLSEHTSRVIRYIAAEYRRPLSVQTDLCRRLTATSVVFDPPPPEASNAVRHWEGERVGGAPAKPALRWALLGVPHGPDPDVVRSLMSSEVVRQRLRQARGLIET